MFSSDKVLARLKELGVELVKVDMSTTRQVLTDDLARSERNNLPVNLLYPADYPASPAIMMPEIFGRSQAMKALDRIAPEKTESSITPVSNRRKEVSRRDAESQRHRR